MNKRPLILISNDDGYQAKGINCLVEMVKELGDIVVCAPESARSGFSCAFSATTPLRLTLREKREGVQIWSCNGTPVDCVKMALSEILDRRPDLVIGGINHGDNASVNSHYSGTMGVTLEGCMKYLPAVAYSLCDHREDADFEPLVPYVKYFTKKILSEGLPTGICLNINFPCDLRLKASKCVAWRTAPGAMRFASVAIRVDMTTTGWWDNTKTMSHRQKTPTTGLCSTATWPSRPRMST